MYEEDVGCVLDAVDLEDIDLEAEAIDEVTIYLFHFPFISFSICHLHIHEQKGYI